jgi:hypothetical protein
MKGREPHEACTHNAPHGKGDVVDAIFLPDHGLAHDAFSWDGIEKQAA